MRRLMRIAILVLALELCVLGVLAVMVSQRRVDASGPEVAGDSAGPGSVLYWCQAGGECEVVRPAASFSQSSSSAKPQPRTMDY
jgi:hypothetical protein